MRVSAEGGVWARIRDRMPWLFSRLLYLSALLQVVQVLFSWIGWVRRLVAAFSAFFFDVQGASFGYAAFLALLAAAIARRKRTAWIVLTVLLALQGLVNLLVVLSLVFDPGPRPPSWGRLLSQASSSAVTTLVMLVLLVLSRRAFLARSPRANILRALLVLLAGLTVTAAVGAILVVSVPANTRRPAPRLEWLLHRLLHDTTGPVLAMPRWVSALLGFLQGLTLLAAFWVLLRSQLSAVAHSPDDEPLVRALVTESPDDSLAYFATRRDKTWCFAPDGQAAVSYRVVLGCCLASSDPIGDPAHWPAAIREWQRTARLYGWTPAVVGASEAGARAYAQNAGLRVMRLGDEAVLEARGVRLDVERHEVSVDGAPVRLALREFELLELLLRNAGRVLTRGQLIDRLWGSDYVGDTKTLDVHIKRLRSKIEADPAAPVRVLTVRGLGYKFDG